VEINIDKAIFKAIHDLSKSRSKFQLERFVLGAHPLPEMQYFQTLLELQTILNSLELQKLQEKKTKIEINRLLATGDEIDEVDAEIKQLSLKSIELSISSMEKEVVDLVSIWEQFPVKFSREDLESAEPEYWKARLTLNAETQMIGQGALNPAHIEAMMQAGIFEQFYTQIMESQKAPAELPE
jgi:hypothetical protein